MSQALRFGVITGQNVSWAALVEQWRQLEAYGFDSAWVPDHVVSAVLPSEPLFEGWTLLAGLLTRTARIRGGVLVTNVALRNPAVLAKQAITVDHLSGGRLELGLGAGYDELEHQMIGVEFLSPPERVRRFGEAVEALERLLRGEPTTYRGRYIRLKDAEMHPTPLQEPRPPLTLAANGPSSLKLAARYADSWNSLGGRSLSPRESLEVTRQRNELLEEYCVALGREPREITRSFLGGFANEAPFASLEAFCDFVGRYREVGINEFIFYGISDEERKEAAARGLLGRMADREMLERVAAEVIPTLRASSASA